MSETKKVFFFEDNAFLDVAYWQKLDLVPFGSDFPVCEDRI